MTNLSRLVGKPTMWFAPLFSPMQIVGFPMGRLICISKKNMSVKYIPFIPHFYIVKLGLTVRTEGPGIDAIKFKVPT